MAGRLVKFPRRYNRIALSQKRFWTQQIIQFPIADPTKPTVTYCPATPDHEHRLVTSTQDCRKQRCAACLTFVLAPDLYDELFGVSEGV